MKATLESAVELWEMAVFAELGVWEPRPDLQLLCTTALRGTGLDPEAIGQVLPGLSDRARRNLLRHLEYVQLIDRGGALTALGHLCAQSGEAPSWEQGVYYLLVATHPLFSAMVLDFKRTPGEGFDRDFDNLEPLPSWLVPDRDRVFTSAFDSSRRFSVASFPAARGQDPVCRGWEMAPARLKWEIDLATGANQWGITGQVGSADQPKAFTSVSESVESTELAGLYASWERRWDPSSGRVLMPFDGRLGQGGRESFLRSWKYKTVKVGQLGSYEDVVARDVPVGPASDSDARDWATAMMVGRVELTGGYVTPSGWHSEWEDVVGEPPLLSRTGDAPDPVELVDVAGKPLAQRTRWLLAAPADLSMES